MYKVKNNSQYNDIAKEIKCGTVYPLSMTQGYQSGDTYTDGKAMLFHHDCGFAFLCGDTEETFLNDVYSLMKRSQRRFVLFSEKEYITRFFEKMPDIQINERFFYEYADQGVLTESRAYSIKKIDNELLGRLDGTITPSFSWNADSFLKNGFGYAVMCENTPVSWAFSAAVCNDEVDIGVETAEKHRGKGLAKIAVNEMIKAITASGKKPVWACHSRNIGSKKLAEGSGFVMTLQCSTIELISGE